MASAPHEQALELFMELVPPPHGTLTPRLHQLPVGAEVTLRPQAKGRFALRPEFRHHVFIATVTGIAPFVSMLRAHLHHSIGAPQFHVLEGASYADEFGYAAELGAYAAKHAFMHYAPSVSRPGDARNAGWPGATGRINTLVEQYLASHGLTPDDTCVYACGHPAMIEDVRARVGGVYTVEFERFWTDDNTGREGRDALPHRRRQERGVGGSGQADVLKHDGARLGPVEHQPDGRKLARIKHG